MGRAEVDEVCGRHAQVERVGTGDRGPFDERRGEWHGRRPRVVANEDPGGTGERDERVPDPARDRLVDLVRIDTANVVGLEDGVERSVWHGSLGSSLREAGEKWYPPPPQSDTGTRAVTTAQSPPHPRPQYHQPHQR